MARVYPTYIVHVSVEEEEGVKAVPYSANELDGSKFN